MALNENAKTFFLRLKLIQGPHSQDDPFPIIAGDTKFPSRKNILFENLALLTDGTIAAAKPDFYDGARLDLRVRKELGPYILPSTALREPMLPNFFTEVKGPCGTEAVVKRQACYDGALGARGVHQIQSFAKGKPTYDNNAYIITSTYQNGTLKMFRTHTTPPTDPGGEPEYHMTQLRGWYLNDNPKTFREGVAAFRSGRDWANEQRDANKMAKATANGKKGVPSAC